MSTTFENCIICNSSTTNFAFDFFKCNLCNFIFRDPNKLLSTELEKQRYQKHSLDPSDQGHISFLQPTINYVLNNFSPNQMGLDYGCGQAKTLAKQLLLNQYKIATYDLFFDPNPAIFKTKYDYITCTEVIEHFKLPIPEFQKIFSILKPNSQLICQTNLFDETKINFDSWWYKNDPTHNSFYSTKNLKLIAEFFNKEILMQENFVVFKN